MRADVNEYIYSRNEVCGREKNVYVCVYIFKKLKKIPYLKRKIHRMGIIEDLALQKTRSVNLM